MRFLLESAEARTCELCRIDVEALKRYHLLAEVVAMADKTQDLPDARSFEERVFARFDALDARLSTMEARFDAMEMRLTALEDKADARLRETRPIWENVQERLTTIETTLEDIQSQLREVVRDLYSMRGRIGRLEDRDRTPAV